MPDQRVRPPVQRMTETDYRHNLAAGLIRVAHQLGPERVAVEIGCNEKTVRNARDEKSSISGHCQWNLLDVDPHALDELAAFKGFMLLPLLSGASADVIPTAGAAIHRIGSNRAPDSPGGSIETDHELIASEAENDALLAAVLERRAAIVEAKLRMASRRGAA